MAAGPLTSPLERGDLGVRVFRWMLRARCLVLFHRFEDVERGEGYDDRLWYCVRCLGPYERDEEFVLGDTWHRLMWRISPRVEQWWDSWAWRFER